MSSWKSSRRIWDISQVLRPGLPVWPGDTEFAFERTWRMDEGSPVNVGRMTMSTHSGTHADAPLHYAEDGLDAAGMELDPYIGTCLVVDARGVSGEVDVADLPHIESVDRVLFRSLKTVERIIGFKKGTGGTPGVPYLAGVLKAAFFPELLSVRTAI